ncbi:transcription initiation protein [Saccharomonospora piscinae]|uniref:Transcription initiation protein n=1 Tax=Saccharomonospora piscinae TaxID=687388 RepID=A0A1V9AC72_SACPI|nr:YciI family protein [Saccharomonospora piscinae]OQO94729.1 transcription initiation protein [Saccharomonospora piscinae]TLW94567.1 transcription initiation protein [Saccharomonospora piscinae]
MAKFIAIGYGDRAGYEQTDATIRNAAHDHDARLREAGAVMGTTGQPVQVRNHNGAGTRTDQGPFMHSELPVAGFTMIEAADIEEATRLISETPCAVAQGVVEIWPLATS